jgi:biopolymer transport protein ExbD
MRRRLFSTFRSDGNVDSGLFAAALSPLVDVLTLLLVALLRTYSADPPVEVPEADFRLATSGREVGVPRGPVVIDVGLDGLYVDGWRVAATQFQARQEGVRIEPLYAALLQRPGDAALVRAHADLPWSMLSRVLATAREAGRRDVRLVARKSASL